MNSKIMSYVLMATLFIGSVFAGASTVTRGFSSATPLQCSSLTVNLDVFVNSSDTHYLIDEIPPAGWVIIDHGTGNTAQSGHIKWIDIQNPTSTSLHYTVSVPCSAIGNYDFSGEYGFQTGQIHSIIGATTVNVVPPVCGNEIVETGEQCDGDLCCSSSCTFLSSSTICRAAIGICDVVETCTGSSATCPADSFVSAGTVCSAASCASATIANLADTCDGAGVCVDSGTQICNPYICGSNACKTSCETNIDCTSGLACNSGVCGQDIIPPVISGVPSDIITEATSSSGAAVAYTTPTANDNLDGLVPVACLPASGSMFVLGSTIVTCTATDSHGNTGTAPFSVTVVDTTAPVITLNGDNPMNVALYSVYMEPGASVSDNYYTGLTATIGGTVTTDAIGTYMLTYNAVDGSGNHAIQVVRTVQVVCQTGADINGDGKIGNDEILNYIGLWQNGTINMAQLLPAIDFWYADNGC